MDVLYFLKERTKFIRQHYDTAAAPFREIIRKIGAEHECRGVDRRTSSSEACRPSVRIGWHAVTDLPERADVHARSE